MPPPHPIQPHPIQPHHLPQSLVLLLFLLVLVLLPFSTACIYTATECQCAVSTTPTKCVRYQSGPPNAASCTVLRCNFGTFICTCAGSSLCSLRPCTAWMPSPPLTSAENTGDVVPCIHADASSRKCISYLGALPTPSASPSRSPSPTPSPTTTLLTAALAAGTPSGTPPVSSAPRVRFDVRIGPPNPAAVLLDLPRFAEHADVQFLDAAQRAGAPVVWTHGHMQKSRFIHVRLYRDAVNARTVLCVIYNKPTPASMDDSSMAATAVATALNGQNITTLICDDYVVGAGVQCNNSSPSVIEYYHFFLFPYTDGFCLSNLDDGPVRVDFTQIHLFQGIMFQSPAGSVREILFDSPSLPSGISVAGLDSHGYSLNGALQLFIDVTNKYPVTQ